MESSHERADILGYEAHEAFRIGFVDGRLQDHRVGARICPPLYGSRNLPRITGDPRARYRVISRAPPFRLEPLNATWPGRGEDVDDDRVRSGAVSSFASLVHEPACLAHLVRRC
jgi:hypothetical protein